jgi:hypothetical protein
MRCTFSSFCGRNPTFDPPTFDSSVQIGRSTSG